VTALESKSSDLATPSYLSQSRPNLKVWTPTQLNGSDAPAWEREKEELLD